MLAATSRSRRMIGLLGAGLVAGALLTGCGGGQTGTAPAAATHPASAAPAADTDADDHADGLAAGLLPADAFGDGATVMAVPLGQLRTMAPLAAAPLAGVDVQPPGCLTALQAMLPQLTAVDDAAVQVARAAGTVSVEALAGPSARVDAVGQLQQLATACSAVDVTAEQYGSAHVSVAPVALPADSGLPDRTTVVAITVAAAGADGRSWNGTALAGVVEDGGRVLALAQAAPQGGTVSSASFTDLLQQAYQTQADAPD